MKGDFSKWGLSPADNFSGVLHQQGRVLLDQDWNAAQQIQALWRDTLGQDVIGSGLVAVPETAADSLKITRATATSNEVRVWIDAGRAWVDGVHFRYDGAPPAGLRAEYLSPPAQPQATVTTIAAGVRDAVVLEVWDEAFSAFQDPLRLLEPALGGPDTTERVKTVMALKLFRLADGEDCADVPLDDDVSGKGRLTVSPSPTVVVPGPCPVPDSGGYTGFEHLLYRIEVAAPEAGQARFKWSQFNGGLVGRGSFSAGTVAITANAQMINQCGLDSFYLEALAFDAASGHWRVVMTADATLPTNDTLALTAISGSWPSGPTAFFRLWNGIAEIGAFPAGLPIANELKDGIRLAFDAATAANANYQPGDYWTFPARAAGVAFDPSVWPNQAPPQGMIRHRAALGVLAWTSGPTVTITANDGEIHDCRQPFLPLAKTRGCCTLTVGDGRHSFGRFTSIQDAVTALPASGGTICVLAGVYDESVRIDGRVDIRIHGCGSRTRIRAITGEDGVALPAFLVSNSSGIALEDMAIEAGPRSAVQIDNARAVGVRRCLLQMRDVQTIWQAIYSRGDDITIESNTIEVLPRSGLVPRSEVPPPPGDAQAPTGVATPPTAVVIGHATRGGVQIGGGSDRVRIVHNVIRGGIWNGITLGSLQPVDGDDDSDTPDEPGSDDECDPCRPPDLGGGRDPETGRPLFRSAGDLYDIEITGNRISDMGINGIGLVRFFDIAAGGDLIGVHGLRIHDNRITRCLRREPAKIVQAMQMLIGYGGIALARVSDLRIVGNEIVANGSSHLAPTCGVFAIWVQGLQIDDNRIRDNGSNSDEPIADALPGIRGGVHVWIVLPLIEDAIGNSHQRPGGVLRRARSLDDGYGAMVRDNLIDAPAGRALTFFALGATAVSRNRLITRGTSGRGLDLLADTVLVGNFGIGNEWTLGLLLVMVLKLFGKLGDDDGIGGNDKYCAYAKLLGLVQSVDPLQLWPPVAERWATGKLLITENQITLDVARQPLGAAISSVLAFSLDDIGFTDNQCEISSTQLFHLTQVLLAAASLREADNRLSETWMRVFVSSMSFGGMNTTTDNQSTHCMEATAIPPQMLVFRDNLALSRVFCPNACDQGR